MASDYRNVSGRKRPILSPREQKKKLNLVQKLGPQLGGIGRETDDRNSRIPAGFTFFGQFLGHDITRDSRLDIDSAKPDRIPPKNLRTPMPDLDSLYGLGLAKSPELYDPEHPGKFFLDEGRDFDLPRDSKGKARIADSRNDRSLILAQLHLAFMKFHNAVYDNANLIDASAKSKKDKETTQNEGRFERTKRLVQWHYQWIILREFLPLLVGAKMVFDIITDGPRWYPGAESKPFVPLEFSVAAYRFGHSQVHYLYRINDDFRFPLFSAKSPGKERHDLRGGLVRKAHTVNWKNFFNTGAKPTPGWDRKSKKINAKLSGPLLFPPASVVQNRPEEGPAFARKSLAVRDLERGHQRNLSSGQEVAEMMSTPKYPVAVLTTPKLKLKFERALAKDIKDFPEELAGKTPLWYYILKEAEVQHNGMMLGDIGGRIVAEVIIGLLQADKQSVIHAVDLEQLHSSLQKIARLKTDVPLGPFQGERRGQWKPVIPLQRNGKFGENTEGDFTMADLLKFAGVDTK